MLNVSPSIEPGQTPRPGLRASLGAPLAILLSRVLNDFLPLPPNQALVGLCDDGLPLLFDLGNPRSGAPLWLADSGLAAGIQMKSFLASTCAMNDSGGLNLHLISPRPRFFADLEREPHCQINFHAHSPEAAILLEEFTNLVEARRAGEAAGPVQLLAMDGYLEFIAGLEGYHRDLLAWLVDAGPEVGVWPLAAQALASVEPHRLDELAGFPTRIAGRIGRSDFGSRLGLPPDARKLVSGYQALVSSGEHLLPVAVVHASAGDAGLLASEGQRWSPRESLLGSFPD